MKKKLEFYVQIKETNTYGFRVIAETEEEAKDAAKRDWVEERTLEKTTSRVTCAWPVALPKYLGQPVTTINSAEDEAYPMGKME